MMHAGAFTRMFERNCAHITFGIEVDWAISRSRNSMYNVSVSAKYWTFMICNLDRKKRVMDGLTAGQEDNAKIPAIHIIDPTPEPHPTISLDVLPFGGSDHT
jgi:hypothetical protein